MSARLVFLDTSVFLTALGEHPTTPACRALLQRAASGHLFVHTAAECLHEVVFHRMRVGPRAPAVAHLRAIRDLCVVHPMDDLVLDRATDLLATTQARGRDAFIAATALPAGFDTVVTTTDDRFVEVQMARRWRQGLPDEVRLDVTAGAHVGDLHAETLRGGRVRIRIRLRVPGFEELSRLLDKLERLPGVERARRG